MILPLTYGNCMFHMPMARPSLHGTLPAHVWSSPPWRSMPYPPVWLYWLWQLPSTHTIYWGGNPQLTNCRSLISSAGQDVRRSQPHACAAGLELQHAICGYFELWRWVDCKYLHHGHADRVLSCLCAYFFRRTSAESSVNPYRFVSWQFCLVHANLIDGTWGQHYQASFYLYRVV